MSRAKAPPRIKGPYSERGGTRFRIRICDAAGRRDLYFPTRKEALSAIREAARQLPPTSKGRSLGKLLNAYIEDKVQQGTCNPRTAEEHRSRLRDLLGDLLEEDMGKLTAMRAAGLYEQLVQTPTSRTGQPPAVATQRFYLKLAKTLGRWAVNKGYFRESPFAGIRPVGRPNRGKKQLRFDEAERFITTAFQLFDERQDVMALAAVTALLLCAAQNLGLLMRAAYGAGRPRRQAEAGRPDARTATGLLGMLLVLLSALWKQLSMLWAPRWQAGSAWQLGYAR